MQLLIVSLLLIPVVYMQALNTTDIGPSAGICYTRTVTYRSTSTTNYQVAYTLTYTGYPCGFLWASRCRRSLTASRTQAVVRYIRSATYFMQAVCCQGYSGDPPDCQASCSSECRNGGNCILPEVCSCAIGWSGDQCELNVDECNGNHGCDHTCTDTPGSFMCSCDDGFVLQSDGRTCLDINECQSNLGGCAQACDNTPGSHRCTCWSGYELTGDGRTCTDIGECRTNIHNCSQECIERDGGFSCDCYPGFEVQNDGVTCIDINECSRSIDGCDHNCRNNEGGFLCTCNPGYTKHHDDPTFCVDIDECVDSNGRCAHLCRNTVGSYNCLCHRGFYLGSDGHKCEDVDECDNSNAGCQQQCTNIYGSYYCTCDPGYILSSNNHSCKAIIPSKEEFTNPTPVIVGGDENEDTSNPEGDSSNSAPVGLFIVSIIFLLVLIIIILGVVVVGGTIAFCWNRKRDKSRYNVSCDRESIMTNHSAMTAHGGYNNPCYQPEERSSNPSENHLAMTPVNTQPNSAENS